MVIVPLAFAEATDLIRTGLGNGSIDPGAFLSALESEVTLRDGSTKKLRVARANDFALLEQATIAAQSQKTTRLINQINDQDRLEVLKRVELWRNSDRSQKSYDKIWGDLRLFDKKNYGLIEGFQTNEQYDDKMTVEEIDRRLDAGIPVPQKLVERINDFETRVDYADKVLKDDKVHPPEALLESALGDIEAAVKDETKVFEYDSLHNRYGVDNASAHYRALYKQFRDADPPPAFHCP